MRGYARRLMTDAELRRHGGLAGGVAVDGAWAVLNLGLGALEQSVWLVTIGAFYLLATVMRLLLLFQMRRQPPCSRQTALRVQRLCGALMLLSVFVLSGVVTLVMKGLGSFTYEGYLVYAYACYAFYAIVSSGISYGKLRQHPDPLVVTNCRVRLCVAMMAIFALETALLGAFSGPEDADLNFIMPILTGTAIALAFAYLGIRSLFCARASKK